MYHDMIVKTRQVIPGSEYRPEHPAIIVAVEGAIEDWVAYIETPTSGSTVEAVVSGGWKLPESLARELFPEWNGKNYRH